MNRVTKIVALAATALTVASASANVTTAYAAPANSISRANAVRMAEQYVEYQGFSFKGLVHQLKFEGFSTGDATYGVSHSGANWTKEAVEVAKSYLETMPFSRSGLIHQLKFDGFTQAQALHGARAAGL